jgi:hypothetical protein
MKAQKQKTTQNSGGVYRFIIYVLRFFVMAVPLFTSTESGIAVICMPGKFLFVLYHRMRGLSTTSILGDYARFTYLPSGGVFSGLFPPNKDEERYNRSLL